MHIRSAQAEDAEQILDIYSHYVQNTAITFEYDVPSLTDFASRITGTLERYPYLVVEDDGRIEGYAYAGPLKDRQAYAHACETSIYVRHDARRNGYGRILYDELERRLQEMGVFNLYACIASPIEPDEYLTCDSEHFHAHMGYTTVGTFHACGYKFGRWYNVIWMEKIISENTRERLVP